MSSMKFKYNTDNKGFNNNFLYINKDYKKKNLKL